MQTLGPSSQPLNITQADVMQILIDLIDVEGLEAARQAFKNMNDYFSVLAGWSDTKKAVHALFAETRRKEQREKFAEQLRRRCMRSLPRRAGRNSVKSLLNNWKPSVPGLPHSCCSIRTRTSIRTRMKLPASRRLIS